MAEKQQKNATPDVTPGGKPAAATKRKKEFKKKRERRIIPHGVVHVAASFNNTQITIADHRWPRGVLVVGRRHRLQGFAQGHAVRRAAGFAGCRRCRA